MDKLKDMFYDPKQGFISVKKLQDKADKQGLALSREQIQEFYDKQAVNQLMKPIRKPKQFNSYVANYPGHIFQMDIMVYDRFTYHNYKYILVVIDIYSRYLITKPMTNRELKTIIKHFKEIVTTFGPPYELQCDNEFNKKEFLNMLDDYDIKYRFSDANEKNKNSVVERVNGTIALMLQKYRIVSKRYDWYNYLDDITENYNTTIHSTTKHTPENIFNGNETNEQEIIKVKPTFKPGNKVRKAIKKKIFDKGDTVKTSKEIFIVESVNRLGNVKLNGFNKIYKPYDIIKITNPDTDITEIPKTETKNNKVIQLLKRMDIDNKNIITRKRNRQIN